MKKAYKGLVSLGIIFTLFLSASLPAFALNSSNCSHNNTQIKIGAKIDEDCYNNYYNYREICNLCDKQIKVGTINIPKSPSTHSLQWTSVGCNKVTHTYKKRCTGCGISTEKITVPCKGNCVFPFSLDSHTALED